MTAWHRGQWQLTQDHDSSVSWQHLLGPHTRRSQCLPQGSQHSASTCICRRPQRLLALLLSNLSTPCAPSATCGRARSAAMLVHVMTIQTSPASAPKIRLQARCVHARPSVQIGSTPTRRSHASCDACRCQIRCLSGMYYMPVRASTANICGGSPRHVADRAATPRTLASPFRWRSSS